MSINLVPFSSDGGFTTAGNITTASYASPAPTINGFSTVSADNFRLMSGNITGGIATVVDDGINSIALALGAQMDVYGFPFSQITRGQLTISDVTTPSEVNGTWYYQSINTYTYQIYTDSTYSTLVDATGWSAYTGGGTVAIVKQVPPANIVINTNGYLSKFDNTGNLTLPRGLNSADTLTITANTSVALNAFSPAGNIVSIQAQGNTSSAVISIFSNAGPVTSNWTFTTAPLDPSESFLYVPNGGAISTPDATGGEGGKNIFIQAGASDPVTWNSNPGGELFIKGGYGSFGDGGGGPGGNVNIEGGASSDSHAGNVNISSGLNTWVFDYTGNLTVPGNISGNTAGYAIGYRDIPQVSFAGNATISVTDAGKHYYSTLSTGNVLTIANNASQGFQVGAAITIINQGTGNITVAQGSGVTLYLAGNATSGNRTVATFGMATIIKVATDTWFINGTGVS